MTSYAHVDDIFSLSIAKAAPRRRFGEEARRLHALAGTGLRVCNTVLVGTECFAAFRNDRAVVFEMAARVIECMRSLATPHNSGVVVRPSLQCPLIGLPDAVDVPLEPLALSAAIKVVFDAWFDPKCLAYRLAHQLSDESCFPALFVQTRHELAYTLTTRACATGERTSNSNLADHVHNTVSVLTPEQVCILTSAETAVCMPVKLYFGVGDDAPILRVKDQEITTTGHLRFLREAMTAGILDELTFLRNVAPEMLAVHVGDELRGEDVLRGIPFARGQAVGRWVLPRTNMPPATGAIVPLFVGADFSPEHIDLLKRSVAAVGTRGGMTSHLAVVSRGLGKPAVGVAGILAESEGRLFISGQEVMEPFVVVDGTTGGIRFQATADASLWGTYRSRTDDLNELVGILLKRFNNPERFAALLVEDQYHLIRLRERLALIGASA